MTIDPSVHVGSERLFRLTYRSRARQRVSRSAAVELAGDAAERNLGNHVSGVLFSEQGTFLQWLEGPADRVCKLMSRIAADPRHTDVAILNAGWVPERCYSGWPMQLAETPLSHLRPAPNGHSKTSNASDVAATAGAFAGMTALYQQQNRGDGWPDLRELAERLISSSWEPLPKLPDELLDMRSRAQLVDDLAAEYMLGWQADSWTSVDVAFGLANLNRCWQLLGRAPEPSRPSQHVGVIVPPGNSEIIGAIALADLLRSSGLSVSLVIEPSVEQATEALAGRNLEAMIVAGSRVGWLDETVREQDFTQALRAAFPTSRIHLASKQAGPLVALPDRLTLERHDARALPVDSAEWRIMSVMASQLGSTVLGRRHASFV